LATQSILDLVQEETVDFEDQLQENEEGVSIDQLGPSPKRRKICHTSLSGRQVALLNSPKSAKTSWSSGRSNFRPISTFKDGNIEPDFAFDTESAFPLVNKQSQWDLPSTFQEDCVRRLPMSIFSEEVSTIPDNTTEIKQLAEEATLAVHVGQHPPINSDMLPSEAKSSIPWSDILLVQSEGDQSMDIHAEEVERAQDQTSRENDADHRYQTRVLNGHALDNDLRINNQNEVSNTPPGTPVGQCELGLESLRGKLSNPRLAISAKRQSKKRKKLKLEDTPQSEDELTMTNEEKDLPTSTTQPVEGYIKDMNSRNRDAKVKARLLEQDPSILASMVVERDVEMPIELSENREPSTEEKLVSDVYIVQTKRGRGRPQISYSSKDASAKEESPIAVEQIESQNSSYKSSTSAQPLAEMEFNPQTLEANEPLLETEAQTTETQTSLALDAKENSKSNKTGPLQDSTSSNWRVPYRVGLSKRTRIAPLLKVLRK
jgi:hypothetical protein